MAAPGEKKYIIRIAFSIIGILVGLSIFIVFGFNYKNWNVAVWGIMSGCHLDHLLNVPFFDTRPVQISENCISARV